jgi:DNA-binding CsgD family transcriptional regulator
MLLTEPDTHQPLRPSLMRQLFDITTAETNLASALMAGKSVEEYGAQQGLSPNTVRTQIKALLAKTGTNRQAELVALLARIPVTG